MKKSYKDRKKYWENYRAKRELEDKKVLSLFKKAFKGRLTTWLEEFPIIYGFLDKKEFSLSMANPKIGEDEYIFILDDRKKQKRYIWQDKDYRELIKRVQSGKPDIVPKLKPGESLDLEKPFNKTSEDEPVEESKNMKNKINEYAQTFNVQGIVGGIVDFNEEPGREDIDNVNKVIKKWGAFYKYNKSSSEGSDTLYYDLYKDNKKVAKSGLSIDWKFSPDDLVNDIKTSLEKVGIYVYGENDTGHDVRDFGAVFANKKLGEKELNNILKGFEERESLGEHKNMKNKIREDDGLEENNHQFVILDMMNEYFSK